MEIPNRSNLVKRSQELHKEIESLQKELNDLQHICPHIETLAKQPPGQMVKKYCKDCNKDLGYLNDKEIQKYLYGNSRSIRKDRKY